MARIHHKASSTVSTNTRIERLIQVAMVPSAQDHGPEGLMASGYGRYWIRTSDPFRVKEVRYRCANRPCSALMDPTLPAVRYHRF